MQTAKRPPLAPVRRGRSRLPWATNVALCIVLLVVAVAVLKDQNGQRDGTIVQDVRKARHRHPEACSPVCCGTGWQQQYARLHADILSGRKPPRFLAARSQTGLADSLKGINTMLWLGLLTDRALVFRFKPKSRRLQPRYEWAFSAPYINWTWCNVTHPILSDPDRVKRFRLDPGRNENGSFRDRNKHALHIRNGDLRELYPDVPVLDVWTNLGLTARLFDNPHHRRRLFDWGLRPDTAFKCAMDFLFEVRPEVRDMYTAELTVLQDPHRLKVGIQVRAGDDLLLGRNYTPGSVDLLAAYDAFFDCAAQIEAWRLSRRQQEVVWFLAADSIELRQAATERFGGKVLTKLDASPGHVVYAPLEAEEAAKVFRAAAGDMWLMSFTDFQVITQSSGFGRVGAMWSGRWHATYSIDSRQTLGPTDGARRRDCGPLDYDSMRNLTIIQGGI